MKRVLTMFFTALLVLCAVPQMVHAAEPVTLTVEADKEVVNPGDTVNYTVSIGAVDNLGGLEFLVNAPDGLTIMEESVEIPDGVAEIIDSDGDIVKPTNINGYKWSYNAQRTGYTANSDLVILTFSAIVNETATFEELSITLNLETCFDNSLDLNELATEIVPAAITVEKPKVAVNGITLDKSTLAMKDGETTTLVAAVSPDDADNKNVTWSSDNTDVATVVNGTVTALKAGTAKITVTTEDGNKKAYCTVTVTCAHAMTKTDAVTATCTEDGNITYYTCSKCDKKFLDEAGIKEAGDVVIKAVGHKVIDKWEADEEAHWKGCENCSERIEEANHSFNWIVDQVATEDAAGIKHEECACGFKRSENTEIPKLDHVHTDIKAYAAVEATCIDEGNLEYWTCSSAKCDGKYYADAACQMEIADIIVPKNPENHVADGVWNMDVEKHVRICACGANVDEEPHAYDDAADVYCNVCNYKRYYIVTSGANAVYVLNTEKDLIFETDGELSLFQTLEIDGVVVEAENYTLAESGAAITLKNSYLNTLTVGTYEIKMLYSDGRIAITGFSVKEEKNDNAGGNVPSGNTGANTNNGADHTDNVSTPAENEAQDIVSATSPKTGDVGYISCWIGLLLAAVVGMAGIVAYRKKNG